MFFLLHLFLFFNLCLPTYLVGSVDSTIRRATPDAEVGRELENTTDVSADYSVLYADEDLEADVYAENSSLPFLTYCCGIYSLFSGSTLGLAFMNQWNAVCWISSTVFVAIATFVDAMVSVSLLEESHEDGVSPCGCVSQETENGIQHEAEKMADNIRDGVLTYGDSEIDVYTAMLNFLAYCVGFAPLMSILALSAASTHPYVVGCCVCYLFVCSCIAHLTDDGF